jgi:L-cysteine S-thiosulfotransferase
MNRHTHRCWTALVVLGACLSLAISSLQAQRLPGQKQHRQASTQKGIGHGDHQTPQGWHFSWPQGDPVKGREAFVKLECYSCHTVQGEQFPAPSGDIGPELAAMGPLHEAAYFAEAIINPNTVIESGKGYEAADGASKMPSYNDLVTVQEVVDLVAYLKGLKPIIDAPPSHGKGSATTRGGHTH